MKITGKPLISAMRYFPVSFLCQATAKPGFLDRLIHAEATTVCIPLVTFEKAAAHSSYQNGKEGKSESKSNPKSTTIKNHLYIIKASYPEAPQSGA